MYRVKEINLNEKPLFLRAFKTFDDAIAYVSILYRTKKWKVYEIEYKRRCNEGDELFLFNLGMKYSHKSDSVWITEV